MFLSRSLNIYSVSGDFVYIYMYIYIYIYTYTYIHTYIYTFIAQNSSLSGGKVHPDIHSGVHLSRALKGPSAKTDTFDEQFALTLVVVT